MAISARQVAHHEPMVGAFRPSRQSHSMESADDIARSRWKAQRGRDLFRSSAEVVGAFPGAIERGHRLRRTRLTITERYLICDEWSKEGFAIDVENILDIAIVPAPSGMMSALRVRYQDPIDEGMVRSFVFCLQGVTVRFYGVRRMRSLARLFADAGIPVVDDAVERPPRRLALSWDAARLYSAELMVWSGKATAPVGGWMARGRVTCRVWVTGKSLFWCDPNGAGVNRIPLDDIVDISAAPDANIPALAVALIDATGARQELLFGFQDARDRETNRRECQTLVNAFASRDVAIVDSVGPDVPWLASGLTTHSQLRPVAVVGLSDITEDMIAEEVPEPLGKGSSASFTMFEAECLAEIASINQEIIAPGSSSEDDSAFDPESSTPVLREALDAIATHLADGSMDIEDADNRARRLKLLSDSRVKLRAIRHQQVVGLRAKSALLHERRAVMTSLNDIMA